jgi:uncharacterized protein
MKSLTVLAAFIVLACGSPKPPQSPAEKFEMQSYQLVLLRRGPVWTAEKTPETKKLFEGHMANINAMAASCKLVVAGPIDSPETDRTALAGIFIFNADRAEVDGLLKNDPAIAIGRLVPEIHAWYGDAQLAKRCKPTKPS